MKKEILRILKDEEGQGMVEYGLILGLIAIAAIVALIALGPKIKDLFQSANDALDTVPSGTAEVTPVG